MRKIFLVIFLFTLCSSRRIHKRSEDVDPLLKELFSEINDPVPKDRRDGQTSADQDAGTASTTPNNEDVPNDSDVPTDKPEKSGSDKSDDSLMLNADSADKQTTTAPGTEAKTTSSSQDNSMDENAKETEAGNDDASMSSSDSEGEADSSSTDTKDNTKPESSNKESADAPKGETAINEKQDSAAAQTEQSSAKTEDADKESPKTADAETAGSKAEKPAVVPPQTSSDNSDDSSKQSAETTESEPSKVAQDTPAVVTPEEKTPEPSEDQADKASENNSPVSDEKPAAVSSEKAPADSDTSGKQETKTTEEKPEVTEKETSADASAEGKTPEPSEQQAEEAPAKEPAVSNGENSAVASPSSDASSSDASSSDASSSDASSSDASSSDASSSDASSSDASSSDEMENKEQTDAPNFKDQPEEAAMGEAASETASAPPQSEETPSTDANTDSENDNAANQVVSSPSSVENTVGDLPEAAANVAPSNQNLAPPSDSSVDVRSHVPAAPSTLSQAAWSAASPLSVAPQPGSMETNEKRGSIRKDSIPGPPAQAGGSSFPLQLNKHSPGADLIKRFFIAKKQAKLKKEEDAKMKSLIGDGKFTVSSNNGYYNYAAAQPQPQATPTGLVDNGQEGACVDKYDSCPEFARNHYCTDYKALMKVQCKKSCKFCDGDEEEDDDDDDDEDAFKTTASPKDKDDDDDDEDSKEKEKSDKKADDKEEKKESSGSEDENEDEDEDDDDKQGTKKVDDDDDDEDGLDAVLSDDKEGSSDAKDKKASSTSKDVKVQDSGSGTSDKGSGKDEDLPPTAEEFETDDEDDKEKNNGSGSEGDESKEDDDSDELAKDLAEQELFSEQKPKKSTIPRPQPDLPAAYPKIDLKDIARYVSLYRNVAKKLFGEALNSAKKEFVAQQSKRSDIPVPIKERLRSEKNSGDSLEGFYSSQDKKRDQIPAMDPNNAQYTQTDEQWANKAYQEAESYLRSKIPEFKNYAPPAMFNYPFYINDPKKAAKQKETNEGTTSKKSEIPESPEQQYNKTLTDILRRDHVEKKVSDPYEYLRDMIPGSSMKPIASKNGIEYIPDTYSRPLQLRTKSQWFDVVAKKRTGIPRAPAPAPARNNVVRPAAVPQMQTGPEALAAQMAQYKSTVSGTTSSPDAEQGTARSDVSQPELQQLPEAENVNFLQSNQGQGVEQTPSFQQIDSRSKVAKQPSPLARVNRQAQHKGSTHGSLEVSA